MSTATVEVPSRFALYWRLIRLDFPTAMTFHSVTPVCVSERRTVEFVPINVPLGHELVHKIPKPIIVTAFDQVDHLMHHDVLNAGRCFFHQFKIQPDSAGVPVERPPAGLHLPDANLGDPRADLRFPFCEKRRHPAAELMAIPLMKYSLPLVPAGTWANA